MRDSDLDGKRLISRVKGRPALERRLRGLLIAVHRFGRQRAHSRADVLWTARMVDALTAALQITGAEAEAAGPPAVQGLDMAER